MLYVVFAVSLTYQLMNEKLNKFLEEVLGFSSDENKEVSEKKFRPEFGK